MSGSTDAAARQRLRRDCRQRRRACLAAALPGLLAVLGRELPARRRPGGRLGLYWPVGSEPDWRPLASDLGGAMALPAIAAPGGGPGRLVYLPWSPGEALAADACGIPAPVAGDPLPPAALDLLLVPALAIDRSGLRLGSGGGWYDRLRADPAWRAVPALAVLPAACVLPVLAPEPWDVPFDGWIDEHGLHTASASAAAPGANVASS